MQVWTAGDRTEHVNDWSVSARTDFSQRAANVGEFFEQKPEQVLFLKTPSSRSRSEAFVKPHQAGDACNNRERITDLNT